MKPLPKPVPPIHFGEINRKSIGKEMAPAALHAFNATVSAAERAAQWQQAVALFQQIHRRSEDISRHRSISYVIDVACRYRCWILVWLSSTRCLYIYILLRA